MAKLIKSILANRMMFRGGGLVPPSQAAGILASSSPLIDSVTLNEGGLVNYARGGFALGARPAGLKQSVPTTYMDIAGVEGQLPSPSFLSQEDVTTPIANTGYYGEASPLPDPLAAESLLQRAIKWGSEEAASERSRGLGDWFSGKLDERAEEAKPFIDAVKKVIATADAAGDDVVEAIANTLNVPYEEAANIVNQVLSVPSPAGDMIPDVSVAEQVNGTSPMAAVAAAPQSLVEDDWRDRPALVPAGYTAEAAKLDALRRFAEGERHRNVMTEEGATLGTELPPVLKGWAGHGPSGSMRPELGDLPRTVSEVAQENLAEITAGGSIPGETLAEELLQSDERMKMRGLELVRSADRRYGEGLSQHIRPLYTDDAVSGPETETETVGATTATDTDTTTTTTSDSDSDSDTTNAVNSGAGAGAGAGASGFVLKNTVADEIVKAAQADNPEDLKDWIKVYKEEFIDVAPEYEGASDFEKGMAWVKTGMAIAGGTSPHAIKNIADGFLSTIDEHTTDAKEKRQYERQIKLSAANYAITANNKRRDEERTIEREGKIPIEVMALKNMYDSEGELTHKKGDIFNVSTSEFINNPNDYGGKLAIESSMLQMELNADAIVAQVAAVADYRASMTAEDKTKFFEQVGVYKEHVTDAAKNLNMYTIINRSIDLSKDGNVTGLSAVVAKAVNKGFNFFNIKRGSTEDETGQRIRDPNASIYKSMAEATDEDLLTLANETKEYALDDKGNVTDTEWRTADERYSNYKEQQSLWAYLKDNVAKKGRNIEEYNMNQQRLANLLIRELLGEGSKNISNIDRELAKEIVGLYEDYAFVDPVVLQKRLMSIESNIREKYRTATRGMREFEGTFGEYLVGPAPKGKDTRKTVRDVYIDPAREDLITQSQVGSFDITSEEAKRSQIALDSSGYTLNSNGIYVFN